MVTTSSHPLENRSTSHGAASYYRERANVWRESAMAVPDGAPQQAVYVEIAEGYERLAAHYEKRERLEKGSGSRSGASSSAPSSPATAS
jgi:hypothetical protein